MHSKYSRLVLDSLSIKWIRMRYSAYEFFRCPPHGYNNRNLTEVALQSMALSRLTSQVEFCTSSYEDSRLT